MGSFYKLFLTRYQSSEMHSAIFSFLTAILFIFFTTPSQGQLVVTTGGTADDLASAIAGSGVTISGATLDCPSLAYGLFDGTAANVDIDSGIILTSGKAIFAKGPNNTGSKGFDNGTAGDADLTALPGIGTTWDACVLEFDVLTAADTLKFNYVFGSDEYPEFVGSINDVFAFWISGPGIVGAENMATVPGTTLPVGIPTINAGSYSMYYISNGSGTTPPMSTDPFYIQYDGFTTVLTASHEITPCETYHLKLAIADQSDHIYDSGVFLQFGSLTYNLADFSYPGTPYCSDETDPSPVLGAGAIAGTFTSAPAGLVIDSVTGTVDLSASIPGIYTVTNSVTGACEPVSATSEIEIDAPPSTIFSYTSSTFCTTEIDPSPVISPGSSAGTFTASPAGLVINASTGVVDLSASAAGTYIVTNSVTPVTFGCGIVSSTTTIIIQPVYSINIIASVCTGESYTLPDGSTVSTAGIYNTVLTAVTGCDSTINTFLSVHPVYDINVTASICSGENYILPDGSAVTTAGIFITNLSTPFGCDSVITTTLSVNPVPTTSVAASICNGDFYTLPDGVITSSGGTYTSTLSAASGCDSIVTTTLTLLPVYSVAVSVNICTGTTYTLPDGVIVSAAGTYNSNLVSSLGCDSTIITTVNLLSVVDATVNASICAGENYILPDGSIVTASGTYVASYTTAGGCDSVITTNLTVNPNPVINFNLDDVVCIENNIVILNATPAGGTYSGTAVSGNEFYTTTSGVGGPYEITYYYTDANGCSDTASDFISVAANFAEAFGDTTIISGTTASISGNTGGDYNWSPAFNVACSTCQQTTANPQSTTIYTLSTSDINGCTASDQLTVFVIPDPGNIVYIPNAFTPNGDLNNDYFFAYALHLSMVKSLRIYDRWGNLIFERDNIPANDVTGGWDGAAKNVRVNDGVYAYIFELLFDDGSEITKAGNVTVLK